MHTGLTCLFVSKNYVEIQSLFSHNTTRFLRLFWRLIWPLCGNILPCLDAKKYPFSRIWELMLMQKNNDETHISFCCELLQLEAKAELLVYRNLPSFSACFRGDFRKSHKAFMKESRHKSALIKCIYQQIIPAGMESGGQLIFSLIASLSFVN